MRGLVLNKKVLYGSIVFGIRQKIRRMCGRKRGRCRRIIARLLCLLRACMEPALSLHYFVVVVTRYVCCGYAAPSHEVHLVVGPKRHWDALHSSSISREEVLIRNLPTSVIISISQGISRPCRCTCHALCKRSS